MRRRSEHALLLIALVVATAPAWRLLAVGPEPSLEALLRLVCRTPDAAPVRVGTGLSLE